jgi:hypothetical protein
MKGSIKNDAVKGDEQRGQFAVPINKFKRY